MSKNTPEDMSVGAVDATVPTSDVTLVSPDGRSYVTNDPTEITNLRAAGYIEKSTKK